MKREEHYCDKCSKQMTEQDREGDTVCLGVKVLAQKPSESHAVNAGVVVVTTLKHSCGSSSSRHTLHGTEFCSFGCFHAAISEFIEKVQTTMEPTVKDYLIVEPTCERTELINRLRLGASISRDRRINEDFAAIADDAADMLEADAQPKTCTWTLDDDELGTWASSCGELWSFIDGGPDENRVSYCHHCGGKVAKGESK